MPSSHSTQSLYERPLRMLTVALYSERYPAIGENHGLSAVSGAVGAAAGDELSVSSIDMVEWGEENADRLIDAINEVRPHILGIGLQYGTFSFFKENYARLRRATGQNDPLIIVGGPLATYLSDRILEEVASDAVVVVGEADEALPRLVQSWMRGDTDWSEVPNLRYRDRAESQRHVRTNRRLVNLEEIPRPARGHLKNIIALGGEIFVETSRGCSWAACTFCLRGLTDIQGRGHEYRRKPPSLVAEELCEVAELGVRDVTIADEDFLGGHLDDTERFVHGLLAQPLPEMRFDASLTVHSVCTRRDSAESKARRLALLQALVGAGLQKVFLGIESCSPAQLKRYAKGHTRAEAAEAAAILRSLGVRVEVGVILFDPLCGLDEIEDSLRFMREHNLASVASGISAELRLQDGTHYLALLRQHEARTGVALHSGVLDPDTLTYAYTFADPDVQRLHRTVKSWNERLHSLYYPAKSLSRFGSSGALGGLVHEMRKATNIFRDETCDAIIAAIGGWRKGADYQVALDLALADAGRNLADSVIENLGAESAADTHPVIRRALTAAHNIDHLVVFDSRRQ
ncbi:B12-binding domain-containing radical SAM protein [Micromonospora zingiberis]|uniref:B12-binding domain-containing radical SAM protein n=1 Tax=Micromonospora zingiberis TaxID=2053011 RepID=A0A4R0GJ61_9ACTN|nr:radical SAM protein [Micromonospora zingiberis]TCB96492.1 B12-binding domain-containing radical SAM protein [Micromonospora zingiberis]